jgi:hypothetical protein
MKTSARDAESDFDIRLSDLLRWLLGSIFVFKLVVFNNPPVSN